VVWEDSRSGTTQIWTMDLATSVAEPLSPSTHPQYLNAIDENRVVWTEPRYGNYDIFMFTISSTPTPVCGDGTCNGTETCSSCPADCGACPPTERCGDGICQDYETCSSCALDCGECPPAASIAAAVSWSEN